MHTVETDAKVANAGDERHIEAKRRSLWHLLGAVLPSQVAKAEKTRNLNDLPQVSYWILTVEESVFCENILLVAMETGL